MFERVARGAASTFAIRVIDVELHGRDPGFS